MSSGSSTIGETPMPSVRPGPDFAVVHRALHHWALERPDEVEKAILAHPKVAACVVHAVESAMSEDDIKVCVVAADGAAPTVEELFDFFVAVLPRFAVPAYLEFVDTLPTNALGRVMKYQLRARGVTPETINLAARGLIVSRERRRTDAVGRV